MSTNSTTTKPAKILAIASRGGHWIQLLRLREAFEGQDVTFATSVPEYAAMVPDQKFRVITEASRKSKFRLMVLALQVLWLLITIRPDVVISTGAAPGYFAVMMGRWIGARTLWIDSIANAEEMSMSGKLALRHANAVLTQWSHLSQEGTVQYHGAVI
ncbi:UDP-N-acetylglucosamine--LPS N-acetylglucosamine transferase [Blastopirellula marina]|uniref:UDP-N-acetylglucosamine--LPS N-acetylglucosamine transferase n=1 Tax=Blastopirellula marina TaxID=124 RepID=A0A2S8GHF5_9BACT|nr:UDP-N-acetylglucosamine--LPS N-acetylglucosamine transferase [Blastopirellula marina]PQO43892.1 UDP-N-acetylglucosamine--LPS N-acetylglucosamine transferase [Blastopirellula marina]